MSDFHRHDTYNPSTGLPMVGAVDVGGYAFGQSSSDRFTSSTSSFNNYSPIPTMPPAPSAFDSDTFRSSAHNPSMMHQGTGSGFGNAVDSGSAHYVNVPQTRAGQIAVSIFFAFNFIVISTVFILAFIGVF